MIVGQVLREVFFNFGGLNLFGREIGRLAGMQPNVLLQYKTVSKAFMAHRALMVDPDRRLYSVYTHMRF